MSTPRVDLLKGGADAVLANRIGIPPLMLICEHLLTSGFGDTDSFANVHGHGTGLFFFGALMPLSTLLRFSSLRITKRCLSDRTSI